jgi:hypothetical protein
MILVLKMAVTTGPDSVPYEKDILHALLMASHLASVTARSFSGRSGMATFARELGLSTSSCFSSPTLELRACRCTREGVSAL